MSDAEILRADAFEIHRAHLRGLEIAYLREGIGGKPLLLLHGWPETKRIWHRNVVPLAAAGFEVIVPDLRGFGDSGLAPDGFYDLAAHSRDLDALVHDHLGHDRAVVVGGDLGGAILQDFSARFPSRVERQVIFNAPLPYLKEEHAGLRTRAPVEAMDYYVRHGTDADALAAELRTPEERRRYVAPFYGSRFWGAPGGFTREAVDFMTEPFADAAKLRAGFGNYEAAMRTRPLSEPPLFARNATPTVILFGPLDHVICPDFDLMAAKVFADHVGPFHVRGAGHFLQWEAAALLNRAIRELCGPRP